MMVVVAVAVCYGGFTVGEEADPKSEQFWIIGLKGEQLLCVPCDPDTEQPPVDERPEIVGFPLSIPLVKDTPVGVDEERHLKYASLCVACVVCVVACVRGIDAYLT